jgi:hypothetical protein
LFKSGFSVAKIRKVSDDEEKMKEVGKTSLRSYSIEGIVSIPTGDIEIMDLQVGGTVFGIRLLIRQ